MAAAWANAVTLARANDAPGSLFAQGCSTLLPCVLPVRLLESRMLLVGLSRLPSAPTDRQQSAQPHKLGSSFSCAQPCSWLDEVTFKGPQTQTIQRFHDTGSIHVPVQLPVLMWVQEPNIKANQSLASFWTQDWDEKNHGPALRSRNQVPKRELHRPSLQHSTREGLPCSGGGQAGFLLTGVPM